MPREKQPSDWSYYSKKRILHQWTQVALLRALNVSRVIEVGPALGLVTAMLRNAGMTVTTLDFSDRCFSFPETRHIQKNLLDVTAADLAGHDAILCCETLEHISWERLPGVLAAFRESGARHVVISVPYMGFQMTWEMYLNRHIFRNYFSLKKLMFLRRFRPEPEFGHQWEVGYRGRSLKAWEGVLTAAGFRILKRDFTSQTRTVFHVLETV